MSVQSRDQQQHSTNTDVDTRIRGHFMDIADVLDVRMDDRNPKEEQHHVPPTVDSDFITPRKTQSDIPFFGERFAHNMKVSNIIVQCGSKKCASISENIIKQNNGQASSIVEMVSSIESGWKAQAEALALSPMGALEFYRRQYDQLCTVLSIQLFNHRPESPSLQLNVATKDKKEGRTSRVDDGVKRTGEGKRKRNATPINDCEYIFFEKNNKFIYRRVESAAKYAKRNKPTINRYVCILPRGEEYREHTRNCITKLRTFDAKFISGSEINFNGTLAALQEELNLRLAHISLDRFSVVNYVDESGTANGEESDKYTAVDDNDDITRKILKKAKTEGSKTTTKLKIIRQTAKPKNPIAVENERRSGIEDYTESEDSSDSEIEQSPSTRESSRELVPEYIKKDGNSDEVAKAVETLQNYKKTVNEDCHFERPPSPFLIKPDDRIGSKESKRKR